MRKLVIGLAALAVLGGGAFWFVQYGERSILGLSGPAIGKGNSTEEISEIDLGAEIPGMDGYRMRARYVVAKPNGVIRIHDHRGRPAFSYIVSSDVVQLRSDADAHITHGVGELTADTEIAHAWRNLSATETARWYVVDIYNAGGNAGE